MTMRILIKAETMKSKSSQPKRSNGKNRSKRAMRLVSVPQQVIVMYDIETR
jgi:hypothetical protein